MQVVIALVFFAIGHFFKVQAPFLKMSRVGYIKLQWAQCHSTGISAMLAFLNRIGSALVQPG